MSTSELPPNAPAPRLCHLVKWADFDGYGFNLHAEKSRTGQFIGKVDDDSPAQYAALREGDRIIEVNGVNIANENHRQVVERIKSVPNETRLLVVDEEADRWYKVMKYVVKSTQPNVEYMKTPVPRPSMSPPSYDNISSSPVNGVEKTSNGVEHYPVLGNGVNGSRSSTPSGSPALSLKANGDAPHVEEELKDAKAIDKKIEDSPQIKSEEIPRVNEIEESVAINEPEESPKIMRNEESPKIMRNEESPKIMRNEESPKVIEIVESPKVMKSGEESPKVMKGEESPKIIKIEESSKIIMEESQKMKSENSPSMKFKDEPGSSRSSTPLDGSGGSIPDSPHSTKSSRSSGGGSSQNGPASPDSALNLNMSASEMRQILAARKKRDPKKVQMDIMQKYEIIQQM